MEAMDRILANLRELMPRSHELSERNAHVLAQEVVGTVDMPYPFYVQRAKGSRVVDVDGKEYIDLTMGFGTHLLGHSSDVAVEAAQRTAAEVALQVGLPNPYQGELADLLVEASPTAGAVVFFNSGTEATMFAIRAARAYTKKTKVALFVGSYHGSHDYVVIDANRKTNPDEPGFVPLGHGIPAETLGQLLLLPYRNENAFDLIRKHADELAVVLIEPVQSSNPRLDVGPFLQELRRVCSECGVLLVMDEVITGFRLGYGGGQEFFGVKGDLATYGKIVGGGMPIGAVVGSQEVMDCFRGKRKGSEIFTGGTFSGNPMSMQVGSAVVRYLKAHPEIYTHLEAESERLASRVNGFVQKEGIRAQLMSAHSMFRLVFTDKPIESAWDPALHRDVLGDPDALGIEHLFYAHLHRNGVIIPGIHLFFLSAAHTPHDVDSVIQAFEKSFLELREEIGAL